MCTIYQKTKFVREHLEVIIGETKVKSFFSYYAIFKNGLLFGLCKNDKFYLRLPDQIPDHQKLFHNLEKLQDKRFGIHYQNFYHIPSSILSQPTLYEPLIRQTLQEIADNKTKALLTRKKQLRSLPNLNINIERILKRLGINSIKEFLEKGAFAIYVELIKAGIDADQTLLFRLYGACQQQYIYTMSSAQKMIILKDANQALYDAGLRKRFKIDEN